MINNKVQIISVCVNYLDYLGFTFKYNKTFINKNLTIISDSKDSATHNFCNNNNIQLFISDDFYKNNSFFNKGAALNSYFRESFDPSYSWILLLDSDIILNKTVINNINKIINNNLFINQESLFCSSRKIYNTIADFETNNLRSYEQCSGYGFFQLFSSIPIKQQLINKKNIFFENTDASEYDIRFAYTSGYFKNLYSLGVVDHIGPHGVNWKGRDQLIINKN
jgi:hypothetical protein